MNDYIGKSCPFCKTPFKPDDDIVVCSVCDMPHHKDCWIENKGCTTFGCLGTLKKIDGLPNSVTSTELNYDDNIIGQNNVYCPRCGEMNKYDSRFCGKCGNTLFALQDQGADSKLNMFQSLPAQNNYLANYANSNMYSYTHNQTANNSLSIDYIKFSEYIEKNNDYYISKFQEMNTLNKKTSWNWCAFLFSPFWLIYRKMYVYGISYIVLALLISLLGIFGYIVSLVAGAIFGVLGNYIYLKQIEKNIVQEKNLLESFRVQYKAKVAGVNTSATIMAAVAVFFASLIIGVIF